MVARLYGKYHGDLAKALAAYDWGEGNLDKLLKTHSGDWMKVPLKSGGAPDETLAYIAKFVKMMQPYGLKVTITNKTGANVNASVAGLGAQP
jgi:hypothetical protein